MREEEKNQSSRGSSFKRFFKKRWVFPALYIASAAIILTAVLWYQTTSNNATDKYDYKSTDIAGKKYKQPSLEVNRALENFTMPVKNAGEAVIEKKFYDFSGKKADQEAALVVYNNTYVPNTGIDITMKNGETFDVVAALSGTVTRVEEDSLLGNVIEIEHDKGVVTQYESVKDVTVKIGDKVEQGQTIAKAGQSTLNEKAGTHLHFEIRKDGVAVNPENYFNKPVSALAEVDKTNSSMPDAKKNSQKIDDSQMKKDAINGDSTKDSSKNSSNKSTDGSNTNTDGGSITDPSTDSTNNTNS
ncbi:peptidoglycan DD-metalloendopeptidase family protein [Bacillota bacterium Lsc_1132]